MGAGEPFTCCRRLYRRGKNIGASDLYSFLFLFFFLFLYTRHCPAVGRGELNDDGSSRPKDDGLHLKPSGTRNFKTFRVFQMSMRCLLYVFAV